MTGRESYPLVVAKGLVAASGVCLFLYPMATFFGLAAAAAGTVAGYVLARVAHARGLRVLAGLAIAGLAALLAKYGGQFMLDHPAGTLAGALRVADAVYCGIAAFALLFGIRMVSQRWRPAAVLELSIVVGAVARTFAAHRHHHITEPRFLTDWAWSHGVDPTLILQGCGVAAIVVAAILLLDIRRVSKLVVSLVFLLAAALIAFWLLRDVKIAGKPDTNDIGLTKDDQNNKDNKDKKGGGSSSKQPDPVAIVVLRDELPDIDILYFRQTVLSSFTVDRMGPDNSGAYDKDVFKTFPSTTPLVVDSPQNPDLHTLMHTSVYLLVDHAQPFGLGHPAELRQLENPNPRQFVAAYDVDSYILDLDPRRLAGRTGGAAEWTPDERAHYLAMPDDPRYKQLSNEIVRDMDPRFVGDDLMKALALKRYLEKNGFYSLSQKTLVGKDPTAKFLFGNDQGEKMKGYCVHFAHAMAFLLRSQGIPSRVSLGYAVQTKLHGAGSSILIMGNDAHAWPEMYLDGVGWITFDVYPEKSDEPPPSPVDGDLESMLGELARKDKTGGKAADPTTEYVIPWDIIGGSFFAFLGGALLAAYSLKIVRRLMTGTQQKVYRGVLDHLSELGLGRTIGETRESHAARVAKIAPSFSGMTRAHLRAALGGGQQALPAFRDQARHVRAELRTATPMWKRIRATIDPISWWFTR